MKSTKETKKAHHDSLDYEDSASTFMYLLQKALRSESYMGYEDQDALGPSLITTMPIY